MDLLNILLIEDPSIIAARERMTGALRYAATKPNWVVRIVNPETKNLAILERLAANHLKIDGIIGWSGLLISTGFRTRRQLARIPAVCIETPADTPGSVNPNVTLVIDNAAIGRTAAEMFLRRGLRHLAYVNSDILIPHAKYDADHSRKREKAFQSAARQAGATCGTYHSNPDDDWTQDLERLSEWIARLPHPCGVFAFNDKRAQKVVDACHLAHVTIPDQIRLIGVDNEVEICENLRPSLTSIQPDFENCGYLAAQVLDDILTRKRPKVPRKISCGIKRIVERASTQDLKGGGRIVAMAREFMRQHATEHMTVDDIAQYLNISVRTLSLRFKDVLNTSPGALLRHYRIERARQLLVETDRPVNDIAANIGFASCNHLKHLFKKTYGQTPGEYRRQHRETPAHINCRAPFAGRNKKQLIDIVSLI